MIVQKISNMFPSSTKNVKTSTKNVDFYIKYKEIVPKKIKINEKKCKK